MSNSPLRYSLQDDVAILAMDDGKANALSPTMLGELGASLDRAEKEAKAVVVVGRPGRFSGGFDLKVMASGQEPATTMVLKGAELFLRIYEYPLPVVMAVSGHAIAGGIVLAATGDTRIGIEGEFTIGLNEVQNSMPVPILIHQLARDRLIASEFVPSTLFSKMYSPEKAVEAGWLDSIVVGDALLSSAMEEAKRLAALPAKAYADTKKSIRQKSIATIRATLEENIGLLVASIH